LVVNRLMLYAFAFCLTPYEHTNLYGPIVALLVSPDERENCSMALIFRAQVQIAVKNRVQMISQLLREDWSNERDEIIKKHLRVIETLMILEPQAGPPQSAASAA